MFSHKQYQFTRTFSVIDIFWYPQLLIHFILMMSNFWQVGAMSKYALILHPAQATWKPLYVQRRKWSIPRIKRVIPSMSISQNKKIILFWANTHFQKNCTRVTSLEENLAKYWELPSDTLDIFKTICSDNPKSIRYLFISLEKLDTWSSHCFFTIMNTQKKGTL